MRTVLFSILLLAMAACGRNAARHRKLVQNKGSDTLVNVAQAWAEHYKDVNPGVAVAVSGGGSGVGISALINGKVDIANASRRLKASEEEQARKNGVEPMEFVVGYDALAVYVHLKNPVEGLTVAQLAEMYGEGGGAETWDAVGVKVPAAKDNKIVRVSRQNNSGTYAYFKKAVLGPGREYRLGSLDMHGSKDVVELVAKTPGAIGYSGLAYATHEVRKVPVAKDANCPFVAPSVKSASDRSYPIARPLLMYTAGPPQGEVKKYLDWVLSDAGQRILSEKGYAPVRPLD
jgi:phosphate transport system substrate-binding protein